MKPFGDALEREMDNLPLSSQRERIFNPVLVERSLGKGAPEATKLDLQKHLFVAVDPGSTRGRSDTAILSFVMTNKAQYSSDKSLVDARRYPPSAALDDRHLIIVGMEVHVKENLTALGATIASHVREIRSKIEGMEHAKAHILIESNLPFAAPEIRDILSDPNRMPGKSVLANHEVSHLDEVVTGRPVTNTGFTRDAVMEPGLWTTNKHKGEMMERIERMLTEKRLHLHRDFVAYSVRDQDFENDVLEKYDNELEVLREELGVTSSSVTDLQVMALEAKRRVRQSFIDQLLNMHRYELPRNKTTGARRYRYTGKIQHGDKDDLVSALGTGQIALSRMRSIYGHALLY